MLEKKAIVAGHICLDITPVFPNHNHTSLEQLLAPGKLLQVEGANVHTGGAVANTGLAMKMLGADVELMGKVGKDAFGNMICSMLDQYGSSENMIISENESTSFSVVLAIPGMDRIFLHNPGANNSFLADDIPFQKLERVNLFHFGYPPIMRSMYENHGRELLAVMKKAKRAGTATSLDMAAIDPSSEAAKVDWNTILQETLPYVDFFVPSIEELCFMLDRDRFKQWQERAMGRDITSVLDLHLDIIPLAERCMKYGAKVLLLKCGQPGLFLKTSGEEELNKISKRLPIDRKKWADLEHFETSYIPRRVLSATGAGDTSIAAFLTAALNGLSPYEAISLAAATGASCVTELDALSGLLSFEELHEKIRNGWDKYACKYE